MKLPEISLSQSARILVVGDLMLDHYLWGHCDRVSPEAPVQVVDVEQETMSLGGAANVVANIIALGATAEIVGVVGEDQARGHVIAELTTKGADTDGLITSGVRPTTVKQRIMAGAQQIVRVDHETATPITPELEADVLGMAMHKLAGAAVLVLSDYGKGVLTENVVQILVTACKERRIPVLVDPKGRDYSKYRGASLITPNRSEAAAATGLTLDREETIRQAGRRLRTDFDLDACLITLSEDGMALFEETRETFLPTHAREVFDVTGAGDTVLASLAVALSCGQSLVDACHFANVAAGLVIAKVGAATVTLQEVARAATRELGAAGKVVDWDHLVIDLAELRAGGRRIVFTNGCFDILHAGHVRYLEAAASLGDALVVGLNDDASVSALKGSGRPINPLSDRAIVLASLASVSFVTPFSEPTPLELISKVQPDVLVKGGDYAIHEIVGADLVLARGGSVEVIPFVEGRTTTATIQRITESAS